MMGGGDDDNEGKEDTYANDFEKYFSVGPKDRHNEIEDDGNDENPLN
jgi:hypothetical protein